MTPSYNPQTDAATTAIRNSMFRSGLVGDTLRYKFTSISEKEVVEVLNSQLNQMADNNTVLSSIDTIATRISKNVFAIAKLMQRIYETNLKMKMLRDRESSRQQALAEETRFEAPSYASTDIEEKPTERRKRNEGRVEILRNIVAVGSVTALAFKKEIESFAEKAKKWIEENVNDARESIENFVEQARNFVDQTIAGYTDESSQEVKQSQEEDAETENLARQIDSELNRQDQEIDDLIGVEDDDRDITDVVPADIEAPELVGQPNTTVTPSYDTSEDIEQSMLSPVETPYENTQPALKNIPTEITQSLVQTPQITNDSNTEPPDITRVPSLTPILASEAVSQPRIDTASYEQPMASDTVNRQSQTTMREIVADLMPSPLQTQMSRVVNSPGMVDTKPPLINPSSLSRELTSPRYISNVPTTSMGVSSNETQPSTPSLNLPFSRREITSPQTPNVGVQINQTSFENRMSRMAPPSSPTNTTIMNNSSVNGMRPEMEHTVPSPIANRGSLEIGVRFRATD